MPQSIPICNPWDEPAAESTSNQKMHIAHANDAAGFISVKKGGTMGQSDFLSHDFWSEWLCAKYVTDSEAEFGPCFGRHSGDDV